MQKVKQGAVDNHRLLRNQGEHLAHIEKFSIEWVLCRTLVFVKSPRYNYIVGLKQAYNILNKEMVT